MQKNEGEPLPQATAENRLQMDHRSKCKTENDRFFKLLSFQKPLSVCFLFRSLWLH